MQQEEAPGISPGVFFSRTVFRNTFFASLFITAGIGIFLLVSCGQSDAPGASANKPPAKLPQSPDGNKPLIIKMFTYTKVDDYGLHSMLSADLLEVRPRRFMAFNAKSVNEAVLRNAHIVLHTSERNEPVSALFDVFDSGRAPLTTGQRKIDSVQAQKRTDAARTEPLGRVTRLIADRITIELFRDGQKIAVLEAAKGLVDKKKAGMTFFNATLQDIRSQRFIKARKMRWDRRRSVFIIPGRYSDTFPSGSVTGSAVEIDLNFMVTPLARSPLR